MTYVFGVSEVGQEIASPHVGQDDKGQAVEPQADPYQLHHVTVVEVLHQQSLLEEHLHVEVTWLLSCNTSRGQGYSQK